ncbi:hypothetical protein ACQ4PT_007266 [Festuca glaucescens]
MAEYDGLVDPAEVALDRVEVWAQIHSIPELYRVTEVVDQLARRIGKVKSVEMNHQRWFEGDYVRVRANIEVSKPLIRFVPLKVGPERKLLQVKYEKIGYFCDVCSVMGHDMEECGDGIHKPEDVQYGKWMIARRRTLLGGQYVFRAPSFGRSRGRGRGGRGDFAGPRKRLSRDAFEEDDLNDTASSPLKNSEKDKVEMEEDKEDEDEEDKGPGGAKKKLDFGKHGNTEEDNDGKEEEQQEGDRVLVPPPPPSYTTPRQKKKPKKAGELALVQLKGSEAQTVVELHEKLNTTAGAFLGWGRL